MKNFVIFTDAAGKVPVLKRIGVPLSPSVARHHKYWVEYRQDKPVLVRPYPGQTHVWDYSTNHYVELQTIPTTNNQQPKRGRKQ